MVTSRLSNKPLYEQEAQGFVVLCQKDEVLTNAVAMELERFYKPLRAIVKERGFVGAAGKSLVVAGDRGGQPVYIMFFGLGDLATVPFEDKLERYRRAIGLMVRAAQQVKITKCALMFPDPKLFGVNGYTLAQETISTVEMACFHFDQFITDACCKTSTDLDIALCVPDFMADECTAGVHRGERIGYAVNQARHWCDLPGNFITPVNFSERTERIAATHRLKFTVFNKEDIIQKGMGGIYAVSKGSAEEPRLVIMEYFSEQPDAPTIALVGKGVTFDSGGLSLKPATSMETMKDDMAGAVVVVSTVEALAHLKAPVNVVAIAPLVENMPSSTATRPGDIITFYNGKTAEVRNTDAEGRLILADALSYAVMHYKLDAIINIATLTGSVAAALGPFYAGLMSKHDALVKKLLEAAKRSGDRLWRLPFHDDYKVAICSDVADMRNTGIDKYRSGAITAGFFLQHFVGDVPWAHLDIAGTAFDVPDMSYYRCGATGFGVRLFVDLITHWKDGV